MVVIIQNKQLPITTSIKEVWGGERKIKLGKKIRKDSMLHVQRLADHNNSTQYGQKCICLI